MQKLSPAYRDDQVDGLPDDVKLYLDQHFLKNLDHLAQPNPKILVVFSAGSAVGKSTLAQKIGDELGALVLENDSIKVRLLEMNPQLTRDERNVLTWQYSMDLYQRLDGLTPNGLVIRDGVIDWYYDRILPVFEQRGYQLFIIAYDISRKKRIELIKKRGDKATVSTERLIEILGDQDIHMARFRKEHTADITLTDDDMFDHEKVIAALRAKKAASRAQPPDLH